jgi:hypothetical protein
MKRAEGVGGGGVGERERKEGPASMRKRAEKMNGRKKEQKKKEKKRGTCKHEEEGRDD